MTHDSRYNPDYEEHLFAQYVRILGKGKLGTRSLSLTEARHAFGMILRGEVEDMQLGAFLMLLRVKEETGEELAGFVQACRENMVPPADTLTADLDWSSYAGKKHQHPWFILSLLLVAAAGHRVFIHGSDGHTAGRLYTEQAMLELGLPVADSWQQVEAQLASTGLSYLSLRYFCPELHRMMQLRHLLGLRSPVNTLARMYNPLRCEASIQSIFHPAYGDLHRDTDLILEQPRSLVFKGDSGEVEIKPHADTKLMLLSPEGKQEIVHSRIVEGRVASVTAPDTQSLRALWCAEAEDSYGLEAVLATTAVALLTVGSQATLKTARDRAEQLWHERDQELIQ